MNRQGAEYILFGGYALFAHGYHPQYRGDPGFGVSTASQREDKGVLAAVTGTWQLTQRTRWITSLTWERRTSTEAAQSFNYWTLAGSLQWVF